MNFLIEFLHQFRPIIQANLENLAVFHLGYLDHVDMRIHKELAVLLWLNEFIVSDKVVSEEQGHVEYELLSCICGCFVCSLDIFQQGSVTDRRTVSSHTSIRRNHPIDGDHDHLEQDEELGIVFWSHWQGGDFCQAFEGNVPEFRCFKELCTKK